MTRSGERELSEGGGNILNVSFSRHSESYDALCVGAAGAGGESDDCSLVRVLQLLLQKPRFILVFFEFCFGEDGVADGDGRARRNLRRCAVVLPHQEQVRPLHRTHSPSPLRCVFVKV